MNVGDLEEITAALAVAMITGALFGALFMFVFGALFEAGRDLVSWLLARRDQAVSS